MSDKYDPENMRHYKVAPEPISEKDCLKVLTCIHCGHTGPDVHSWPSWVGGQGYVDFICCDNIPACWRREETKEQPKIEERLSILERKLYDHIQLSPRNEEEYE